MEVRKLGKYELRATIGRGAVGTVYEAWDPIMARTVAVKTLPFVDLDDEGKEHYARFKREAQAAGRMHHPNIVSAFDYGETASIAYIVMEYLRGPSLKAMLTVREPLSPATIGRIMHGVLAGLQHSHQRGVVHRDIKPGNVVFDADGDVKITDFGIAHLDSSGMTRAGSVLGTPAYMAPEQVLGEPVDARTDIYSAGVVLYEMLTGRRPFEGSTASIMHKIVNLEPPRPSQLAPTISPGIDAIIAKAIAKDPAERYQHAVEFDDALRPELARAPALAARLAEEEAQATVVRRPPPAAAPGTSALRVEPAAAPSGLISPPRDTVPRRAWSGVSFRPLLLIGGAAAAVLGVVIWLILPTRTAPHIAAAPAVTGAPSAGKATAVAGSTPAAPYPPNPQVATPAAGAPTAPAAAPRQAAATSPPSDRTQEGQTDALRQQVGAIVASSPCSIVGSEIAPDGQVRLHGISALGDASEMEIQAALRGAIQAAVPSASVTWNIHRIEGPYCPVLDLLRALNSGPGSVGAALSLSADRTRVVDGEPIRVTIAMPQIPGRLTLDWFTSDGTVHHLRAAPAEGSQLYTTGALKTGKPYGDQLITALVTSDGLFARARPEHEPATVYLKDLKSTLEQVHGGDVHLAADAVSIAVMSH